MLTKYLFIALFVFSNSIYALDKEISITIDDLPFVGRSSSPGAMKNGHDRFNRILQALIEAQIPATGFVIAGSIARGQWQLLENFQKNGFIIGNHTYSHENLKQIGAEKYISDIAKADERLTPLMTTKKYFRYPYLEEGKGNNRQQVQKFLTLNKYTIAPVTIDSKDFIFNVKLLSSKRSGGLQQVKERYLSYILKETEKAEKRAKGQPVKQILLIHANLLNSYVIGDVIQLYKDHGYRFISLDEALHSRANEHQETPGYQQSCLAPIELNFKKSEINLPA